MLVSHRRPTMINVHRLLPRLIVNRRLLQTVIDEPRPCCALGFVEERKTVLPLITLGLPKAEDLHDLGYGFRLGLQGAKDRGAEAVLMDFEFQGREPLQVALDPANPSARRVLRALGKSSAYFVLVVGAHGVTAFRAGSDEAHRRWFDDLSQVKSHGGQSRPEIRAALEHAPHGLKRQALVWLGADDASLLDLSVSVRYELRPAP